MMPMFYYLFFSLACTQAINLLGTGNTNQAGMYSCNEDGAEYKKPLEEALYEALLDGDLETVKTLLQAGANPNSPIELYNDQGEAEDHYALNVALDAYNSDENKENSNRYAIVRLLLEYGAFVCEDRFTTLLNTFFAHPIEQHLFYSDQRVNAHLNTLDISSLGIDRLAEIIETSRESLSATSAFNFALSHINFSAIEKMLSFPESLPPSLDTSIALAEVILKREAFSPENAKRYQGIIDKLKQLKSKRTFEEAAMLEQLGQVTSEVILKFDDVPNIDNTLPDTATDDEIELAKKLSLQEIKHTAPVSARSKRNLPETGESERPSGKKYKTEYNSEDSSQETEDYLEDEEDRDPTNKNLHDVIQECDSSSVDELVSCESIDLNSALYLLDDNITTPALTALERALYAHRTYKESADNEDNAHDKNNKEMMQEAAEIVIILLEHGAKFNVRDELKEYLINFIEYELEKLVLNPTNSNILRALMLIRRNPKLITETHAFYFALGQKVILVIQAMLKLVPNFPIYFNQARLNRALSIATTVLSRGYFVCIKEEQDYREIIETLTRYCDSSRISWPVDGQMVIDSADAHAAIPAGIHLDEIYDEEDDLQKALALSLQDEEERRRKAETINPTSQSQVDEQQQAEVTREVSREEFNELIRIRDFLTNNPELINAPDESGWTLIHHAASRNQAAVIHYLVAQGARLTMSDERNHQTPYQIAVARRCKDAIKMIEELLADTRVQEQEALFSQQHAVQQAIDPVAQRLQEMRNQRLSLQLARSSNLSSFSSQ